ncbi:MAG TPA: hypothetical protein VN373_03340 [Methanosarcina barkeri]|nr:hypothetical protein [Methanosarcina barkeri]
MLKFDISHHYKGTGVSQGLDRGLIVYSDDILLMEEGMGLGACAFQTDGYTHFTSIKSIKKAEDSFEVVGSIDKRLVWTVLGIKSGHLTRALEYITTNIYMKQEKNQELLLQLGQLLRMLFRVNACFDRIPPLGEVRLTYALSANEILVDLSCETAKKGCKLFVLNELGGSIFDKGLINNELSAPPSGWRKIEGLCELYSRAHSLAFTIRERHIPANVESKLYWGREQISNNYCWAGFESELICSSRKFENYRYSIKFREVAK